VCDDESRKYKKKINAEISSAGQRAVDKPVWKILPGVKRKNHKSGECANTSQRWQYLTTMPNRLLTHRSDPAGSLTRDLGELCLGRFRSVKVNGPTRRELTAQKSPACAALAIGFSFYALDYFFAGAKASTVMKKLATAAMST
jgi:hypothetical protein